MLSYEFQRSEDEEWGKMKRDKDVNVAIMMEHVNLAVIS